MRGPRGAPAGCGPAPFLLRAITELVAPCGLSTDSTAAGPDVLGAQRFFQLGARFSAKASGPSVASSLEKTSPEISDSIL
jgi:hypothetical protein